MGEERERGRGGSAEVYIVFGKIQGQSGGQRPAHALAAPGGSSAPVVFWDFNKIIIIHFSLFIYLLSV